jgi:hypothetical protein
MSPDRKTAKHWCGPSQATYLVIALGLAGVLGWELTAPPATVAIPSAAGHAVQPGEIALGGGGARQMTGEAMPPEKIADVQSRARSPETEAWLDRVVTLKRLFRDNPDLRIPEMKFLTGEDWLQAATAGSFDDEGQLRFALSAVRTIAKNRFADALRPTLAGYIAANGERVPSSLAEIAAAAGSGLADILPRYELCPYDPGPQQKIVHPQILFLLREKAAVDSRYDSRLSLLADGGSMTTAAPAAWIEAMRPDNLRAARAEQLGLGSAGGTALAR